MCVGKLKNVGAIIDPMSYSRGCTVQAPSSAGKEVIIMRKKENIPPRVAQFVEMCDFPCKKEDILLTAEECEFPDDVINVCEELPNRTYESEQDVMNAVEQYGDYPIPRKDPRTPRRSQ